MSRKKRILAIFAVVLLFLGDYLYWTVPVSFGKAVAKESWVGAQLWWYDEHFDSHEITIDETTLLQILSDIEGTEVTRRPKFLGMSQPYFMLYLYHSNGYPYSLTIVENGCISITPEMDTDRRKYFDGGGELYQALLALTET